ncbi:MAG: VWA domain-containing protein, partial [Armatimonadia bacterium]|nr:VWA domain-containing protein [Armatimonadia bacterium]
MTWRQRWLILVPAALAVALLIGGCPGGGPSVDPSGGHGGPPEVDDSGGTVSIVSGSENKLLEETVILDFERANRIDVQMHYKGSLDIMRGLREQSLTEYDAVWPANSLWLALGDEHHLVKHEESIMRSPVVLGVKKSKAEQLGWVDAEVTVDDILEAAEAGKLTFMMTSATQSNSGASAYFAFLNAFAGQPEVLTAEHLEDPEVQEKIRRILGEVDRSSGSSGWLKEYFFENYESEFDAMVNYEALIIEMNQALVASGREPLFAVYPRDGLAIADSPLGYLDRGDPQKEQIFLKLQEHLLSEAAQRKILGLGRRVGLVGMAADASATDVFNPDWGIQPDLVISPIKFPPPKVISEALTLYQTSFRKPSFTVYCLDYSGSMTGEGISQLREAMRTILDQEQAEQYLLQFSAQDSTLVIPFSAPESLRDEEPTEVWRVQGNDQEKLDQLLQRISGRQPEGGTDIYTPVMTALELCKDVEAKFPAVVLMSDGNPTAGRSMADLREFHAELGTGQRVPVFGIMFGMAEESYLEEIADLTGGRVFDGRED